MFFYRIASGLKLASHTFSQEGFVPLLDLMKKDAARFSQSYLFHSGQYYLYEHSLLERDEVDFLPRVEAFAFYAVSSNQQADKLSERGDDFRRYFYSARQALDKGAIAFCVFVGGELAHVSFAALDEEAKNTFDTIPYPVNYSEKEACTGGTFTFPKFRGKGLMAYACFKKYQFLRDKGIKVSRNSVNVKNIASQKAHARFQPTICGKVRFVRFLRWKFLVYEK